MPVSEKSPVGCVDDYQPIAPQLSSWVGVRGSFYSTPCHVRLPSSGSSHSTKNVVKSALNPESNITTPNTDFSWAFNTILIIWDTVRPSLLVTLLPGVTGTMRNLTLSLSAWRRTAYRETERTVCDIRSRLVTLISSLRKSGTDTSSDWFTDKSLGVVSKTSAQ